MENEKQQAQGSELSVGLGALSHDEVIRLAVEADLVYVSPYSGRVISPYIEDTDIEEYLIAFVNLLGIRVST